jgi:pantothenate synthetase
MATVLYRALTAAAECIAAGEDDITRVTRAAAAVLATEPEVRVEYLEVVDAEEMQPVGQIDAPVRIAVAAWVGETRLIDNLKWGHLP